MRISSNSLYTHLRKQYRLYWHRWYQMQRRCTDRLQPAYRNVRVCEDWKGEQGFVNFYDHMGLPPTPEHQLDRVNPFGHYEPGNVIWATKTENMNNMRVHHRGDGRFKKLAIENGLNPRTYYKRVRKGWNMKLAATKPSRNRHKRK